MLERTPSRTSSPDGVAAGMLSGVRLEVVDDARLAALDDVLQRAALEVTRVSLRQEKRLVVGARVVREHTPAALVEERQADAVARDQRASALEEEVGEVVQRLLGGDLLIDHAQRRALRVADAPARRAPAKRVEVPKCGLQAHDRPSSGRLPRTRAPRGSTRIDTLDSHAPGPLTR